MCNSETLKMIIMMERNNGEKKKKTLKMKEWELKEKAW